MIKGFFNEFRWLSNFAPVTITYEGITYPSTENAYQAAKYKENETKQHIASLSASKAKTFSRKNIPTDVWSDDRRLKVMEDLSRLKFSKQEFKQKLVATGDKEIVEENYWHDNFFGSCTCAKCNNKGQNKLGKILMQLREEFKND